MFFKIIVILCFYSYFISCNDNIIFTPINNIIEQISNNEITSEQVVKSFYERAKLVNPFINAIVEFNENAINEAKELDNYYKKYGKLKGPLHGIPVTIKEHMAVEGFHQTQGLEVFKDFIAIEDCPLVKRIKNAGGIILGTTNMMESGLAFDTDNPIYGKTHNPFNLNKTPGGSSGGEGAIIAAGGSPLGMGSDLGGSIRVPSHNCGILGIKPTTGRFSRANTTPMQNSITGFLNGYVCLGPLARYVSDLELALNVLSGPEFNDPYTYIPQYIPTPGTITKPIAYFYDDGQYPKVDISVKNAINLAINTLQSEGLSLINDIPSIITQANDLMYRLCGYQSLNDLPVSSKTIKEFLKEIDSYNISISTVQEKEKLDNDIILYKLEMNKFFENYDALILPAATFPALDPHLTHSKEYEKGYAHFRFTYAFNIAQFPAMVVGSVTTGLNEFQGLPVGIQIVVPPFKEDIAFNIARILENNIPSISNLHPDHLLHNIKSKYDEL